MKRILSITLVVAVTCLSACYYDNEEELYPNSSGSANCDTTNQTYTKNIKSIIDSRCATPGCHNVGAPNPDLTTYQNVVALKTRIKVRAIDEKTMPAAAPLPDCEIKKLTAWINAGTPQ